MKPPHTELRAAMKSTHHLMKGDAPESLRHARYLCCVALRDMRGPHDWSRGHLALVRLKRACMGIGVNLSI